MGILTCFQRLNFVEVYFRNPNNLYCVQLYSDQLSFQFKGALIMKLYQLTKTAIITLVSIIGNPLESFSQKKFFIPPALAQDSWVNSPSRIEITKKTSFAEIEYILRNLDGLDKFNAPFSKADKKAIIEDLEKIEALRKIRNYRNYSAICSGYNIAEAWEKAVKACFTSLTKGDDPHILHPIHLAYFGAQKYNKAINSLKQSLNNDYNYYPFVSYNRLGLTYFKLGDYPEAIRQYQKAVESIKKYYEGKKSSEGNIQDDFASNLSSIQSDFGLLLLQHGKIEEAEKKFLEAMKNDYKSWNKTIANLLENERTDGSGLWDGYLIGATGSFTHGLTELRIKQGKYTEALEFAEYGRTRILSYLINKNKESSINIDKIKAIAKQQNATLVKYYMPTSINYPGMKETYKPQLYIWVVQPTGKVDFANINLSSVNSKYNSLIAQLLNTIPITGIRATKSRIIRQMPNANIIHLATHGDPSRLAFAPSEQDQGFLGEGDIYQFNLTADLVVLSACETGLGEITSDGIVGLARPFIGAGVPSIVASFRC